MIETVTLEVPAELAQQARRIASRTQRRFEGVLVDWIRFAGSEPPVESLTDDELLALCDSQMAAAEQEQLSALLELNREGALNETERGRLEGLLQVYRRGLVRKAQALKAAVVRGLRPPLN